MKPKNPPTIASWVLEHLAVGRENEALAGDLLEEFRRGRSASWYWRQVLVAIVIGFAGGLRKQWPAVVYATLCSIPVPAYLILTVGKMGEIPFFAHRWLLNWPYSTISDMILWYGSQLIYIWFALIIYCSLFSLATKTVNLHELARSVWKSALVFIAVSVGVVVFFALLPGHADYAIDRRHVTAMHLITDSFFLWFRLPFFFTIFFSIWMTLSRIERKPVRVIL